MMAPESRLSRLENLILALWVGISVGIGYVAAPVLFRALDDRSLAGGLAGQMFWIVGIVGLIAGTLLVISLLGRDGKQILSQWRFWALLMMLLIVAGSQFVLQPVMAEVKAMGLAEGSDAARKFGMLHGVSSLLYLTTTVLGIILLLAGLRPGGPKRKTLADLTHL